MSRTHRCRMQRSARSGLGLGLGLGIGIGIGIGLGLVLGLGLGLPYTRAQRPLRGCEDVGEVKSDAF